MFFIALAIKYPKIAIPAEAGISSSSGGVCQKIPACDGMTVCLFSCQIIRKSPNNSADRRSENGALRASVTILAAKPYPGCSFDV